MRLCVMAWRLRHFLVRKTLIGLFDGILSMPIYTSHWARFFFGTHVNSTSMRLKYVENKMPIDAHVSWDCMELFRHCHPSKDHKTNWNSWMGKSFSVFFTLQGNAMQFIRWQRVLLSFFLNHNRLDCMELWGRTSQNSLHLKLRECVQCSFNGAPHQKSIRLWCHSRFSLAQFRLKKENANAFECIPPLLMYAVLCARLRWHGNGHNGKTPFFPRASTTFLRSFFASSTFLSLSLCIFPFFPLFLSILLTFYL